MDFEKWLQHVVKKQPESEKEQRALKLWYALLYANSYGWIDTNEYEDPYDAPNYIQVIIDNL